MRGQVLSRTNRGECRSLYHNIHQKELFLRIFFFSGVIFRQLRFFEGDKRRGGGYRDDSSCKSWGNEERKKNNESVGRIKFSWPTGAHRGPLSVVGGWRCSSPPQNFTTIAWAEDRFVDGEGSVEEEDGSIESSLQLEVGRFNPFELFYSYSVDYGLDYGGLLCTPHMSLFSDLIENRPVYRRAECRR